MPGPDDIARRLGLGAVMLAVLGPQLHPHPGEQLVERERLGEVVLRARVQAQHLGRHVGQAGQHQDRLLGTLRAEPDQDLAAVGLRHDQIEDHQVVIAGQGLPQPGGAVGSRVNLIASRRESAGDHVADLGFIIYNKDPAARRALKPWIDAHCPLLPQLDR